MGTEPQTCEKKAGTSLSIPLGSRVLGKTKPKAHPQQVPQSSLVRKKRDVWAHEEGQLRSRNSKGPNPNPPAGGCSALGLSFAKRWSTDPPPHPQAGMAHRPISCMWRRQSERPGRFSSASPILCPTSRDIVGTPLQKETPNQPWFHAKLATETQP